MQIKTKWTGMKKLFWMWRLWVCEKLLGSEFATFSKSANFSTASADFASSEMKNVWLAKTLRATKVQHNIIKTKQFGNFKEAQILKHVEVHAARKHKWTELSWRFRNWVLSSENKRKKFSTLVYGSPSIVMLLCNFMLDAVQLRLLV